MVSYCLNSSYKMYKIFEMRTINFEKTLKLSPETIVQRNVWDVNWTKSEEKSGLMNTSKVERYHQKGFWYLPLQFRLNRVEIDKVFIMIKNKCVHRNGKLNSIYPLYNLMLENGKRLKPEQPICLNECVNIFDLVCNWIQLSMRCATFSPLI